jgi:thymidylate synthase ThyX
MSRVLTIGPMPAEKCAYALARYSRSPDSIRESIEWVRTHDSRKFFESFYFQYGHASIADLGHVVICFEGVSELAATEIEDEQLWDGQARSSRYQDFSQGGFIVPPEFSATQAGLYRATGDRLIAGYKSVHGAVVGYLRDKLPRPDDMKPDAYERNIAARAFDVARYLLFLGIPTGVGQVVSIRTLERQTRRLKSSEYAELRDLGGELAAACADQPACSWTADLCEPVAPTLAKYVDPDTHLAGARNDLQAWARQNLPAGAGVTVDDVDLLRPASPVADIAATLLYPVTDRPYRDLYEWAASASDPLRNEVIDTALRSRTRRDELLRAFRTTTYVYDIVCDIGAYRDLHRHRRCHQFRQPYTFALGFETPEAIMAAGLASQYQTLMKDAAAAHAELGEAAAYILPFGARSRFLFKLDFAEAEYISRLRSGVKGHFSYRGIAWQMKQKMDMLDPELGRLIQAVPPDVEDPLKR